MCVRVTFVYLGWRLLPHKVAFRNGSSAHLVTNHKMQLSGVIFGPLGQKVPVSSHFIGQEENKPTC